MIIENREGFDEYARHFNITQGRLNSYLSVLALGEFDKIIKTLSDASYRELTEIINHQSNHYDKLLRENDKIESIFSRLGSA